MTTCKAAQLLPAIVLAFAAANASAQTFSRTEVTVYHDDTAQWVLGQVKSTTCATSIPGSLSCDGNDVMASTDFDAAARPWKIYEFGKLKQTLTYHADGTIATVADGAGNSISLSSWKRGIPQTIGHPATPDQPAGATESAVVNDNGWITSVTNEIGAKTCYGHDAMGRVNLVTYPSEAQLGVCDATTWLTTIGEFRPLTAADWRPPGVDVGQWRSTTNTGNHHKTTYYDAMWRPVLTHEQDAADSVGTLRSVSKVYDTSGRIAFESYPSKDVIPAAQGTYTFYDALDRVKEVRQDSEHGLLTTTTTYVAPFKKEVVNPRGKITRFSLMAYDQPTEDMPNGILEYEGRATEIYRDPYGKPTQIRRRFGAGDPAASRYYVYDESQQLCKTVEPETAATIMDYDGAGNLAWSAVGITSHTSTGSCNKAEGLASGRAVSRTYDQRNRVKTLQFPDGRGNQAWKYAADNLPTEITTYNESATTGGVVNAYGYNHRRLPTGEGLGQVGWYTWGLGYGYDANGNLASQRYPTNLVISYAPNALGQPKAITGSDGRTYANGVTYYPNGALKQFTYGNGVVHAMTQNARQLPSVVSSSGGVMSYQYSYDQNANPVEILDLARGTTYSRWMEYDGLDRMTAAGSASFGGDHWHRMTYDNLDNLRSWKLGAGGKDHATYYYDSRNQVTNILNSQGAGIIGIGYDAQGNVNNKNGQTYDFDYGNRLRVSTGKEAYRYDGHGRRVRNWLEPEIGKLSMYAQSGQLMYDENHRSDGRKASEYVYFNGSLLATRARNFGTNAIAVTYTHTDALGSPVAVTNEAAQVIDRTAYQPWGRPIAKPTYDGIGYTGHVRDGKTELTYMQQRYYDETIGRFLSVDPVTAYGGDYRFFNRYAYAFNNPYKFTDPDGRNPLAGAAIGVGLDFVIQVAEIGMGTRTGIDRGSILVSAGSGALGVGLAGKAGKLGGLLVDAVISAGSTAAKGEEVTALGVAADVGLGKAGSAAAAKIITGTAAHKTAQRQADRLERIGNKPGARTAQQERAKAAGPALQQSVAQKSAQAGVVASGLGSAGVRQFEHKRDEDKRR